MNTHLLFLAYLEQGHTESGFLAMEGMAPGKGKRTQQRRLEEEELQLWALGIVIS